jgi:hypothetical protein
MSEDVRVRIDDDEGRPARPAARRPETADASAVALTRALAERDQLHNLAMRRTWESYESQRLAAESEAQAGEAEHKAAFDAGDGAGMAASQRKIARAEARAVRMEEAKAELEAQAQRPATSADAVEAYIQGRSQPTADWLRRHTDWIRDPVKNEKLTRAHWHALGEGHAVDSPEYFRSVEDRLGLRGGGSESAREKTSRLMPDGTTVRNLKPGEEVPEGTVHLTRGEYEAATQHITWGFNDPKGRFKKDTPIGLREYIRRRNIQKTSPEWQRLDGY